MLSLNSDADHPLRIDITITSPTVYLDSCVVSSFVRDAEKGEQFRNEIIAKDGTIFLSWAYFLELSGLGNSNAFQRIKQYLASFERRFLILDCDSQAVVSREKSWRPGLQNPAIDEDYLRELAINWDGMSPFDISVLLNLLHENSDVLNRIQSLHNTHRDDFFRIFTQARDEYRENTERRNALDNANYIYTPNTPPTEYIRNQLIRNCITTTDVFIPSDGLDFEHSVVSTAYSDIVILDRKWARRCQNINRPPGSAEIYNVTELQEVIERIRNW